MEMMNGCSVWWIDLASPSRYGNGADLGNCLPRH
jgi:hypothetical protein